MSTAVNGKLFTRGAALAVIALGLAIATACGDEGDGGGGDATTMKINVAMRDNFFSFPGFMSPQSIALPAGKEIIFNVDNRGSAIHNMRTAGADGRYDTDDDAVSQPDTISAGKSGKLIATFQAGKIDFRCDFHPTEMTGRITVE